MTVPGRVSIPYTNLLTPWSRVLLEKPTGSQLVKKFPIFYGTRRRFITALKNARHLSLSGASSIQSMPPPPILKNTLKVKLAMVKSEMFLLQMGFEG